MKLMEISHWSIMELFKFIAIVMMNLAIYAGKKILIKIYQTQFVDNWDQQKLKLSMSL